MTNLLDRYGNPIRARREKLPISKMRAVARNLSAKFDAAQTTAENRNHWANADYLGPNSELDPNIRRKLWSRARYERANNTYCSGMLETLANDTIGTGPSLQVLTDSKSANQQIESLFWDWSQAIDLSAKLRTMREAKACDGEAFATLIHNPMVPHPVQLDIRLHEAEMIADPTMGLDSDSLTDGINFDEFGNVISYSVLREHPGDRMTWGSDSAVTVAAAYMIHLFKKRRAGQSRGYPEITAALPLYAQLRRYTLAVLRSAELAALLTWLIKTQGPPSDQTYGTPMDVLDTERGMGMFLPDGYDVTQLKAEQPCSTYPMFKRELVAEIARVLNMPYNVAAGDSSSYNYSSGRLDHKVYFKSIRVERSDIERSAVNRIFASWWVEARIVPGLLPPQFRTPVMVDDDGVILQRRESVPPHEWRWDGDEHVDPQKEWNAKQTALSIGLTSHFIEAAKQGLDYDTIESSQARVYGLSIPEYRKRLADTLLPMVGKLPGPNEIEQPAEEGGDDEE